MHIILYNHVIGYPIKMYYICLKQALYTVNIWMTIKWKIYESENARQLHD